MSGFLPADQIRTLFSQAMSAMYQAEVPQYATLLDIVRSVNQAAAPELKPQPGERQRIEVERHGAIRLGTAAELNAIRRVFAVMGMFPVGYYDLSTAGIPVHSTAFRPIAEEALQWNPFRVFTSLLRLDLIEDAHLREQAVAILDRRHIISATGLELTFKAERQGGLNSVDAHLFVAEVTDTFRWHAEAIVDASVYDHLLAAHRLIADVVSFKGPHINHLTPRTVDIDAAQKEMADRGLSVKAVIEGPPARRVPILLRQTSFKAVDEAIIFPSQDGTVAGTHTARFGEIEQRGAALTPKGRALYDACIAQAQSASADQNTPYQTHLQSAFAAFPDDPMELRRDELAYFSYRISSSGSLAQCDGKLATVNIHEAIKLGWIEFTPLTYEDFLPVSAAGIFRSNLGDQAAETFHGNSAQGEFESALGTKVADPFALYAATEAASLHDISQVLSPTSPDA